MRPGTSSNTAMLTIVFRDRIDHGSRNSDRCTSHWCASRSSRRDWNRIGSRTTTTNRPSLWRLIGVGNRIRAGPTTADRWVLGRLIRIWDRIGTRTATTKRFSTYMRRVGVGDGIGSRTAVTGRRMRTQRRSTRLRIRRGLDDGYGSLGSLGDIFLKLTMSQLVVSDLLMPTTDSD